MVALLKRNTDESPCSPITQAWMLRGCTPHSFASFSSKRSVSSDVPEPMIDTERPCQRRTRYSVSTSSGLVTTITTRGSPPASIAAAVCSRISTLASSTSSRVPPGCTWAPTVMMVTSSGSNSS